MTGEEVLATLRTVRTTDVSDALDSLGRQARHVMDSAMRPLYPGIRFAGRARTTEYDLIDVPLEPMSYDEFDTRQYNDAEDGLWRDPGLLAAPGAVMVIDAKRTAAGVLGSANTLSYRLAGAVGFVIDGTCRDSYECTIQKTPVFCTVRSPQHPMGRIRPVAYGMTIVCGGVVVNPDDYIVADDDGVIVIPQALGAEVVQRAAWIQDKDRPGRRDSYERLGLPPDDTLG